jgi:hypothetical protein
MNINTITFEILETYSRCITVHQIFSGENESLVDPVETVDVYSTCNWQSCGKFNLPTDVDICVPSCI